MKKFFILSIAMITSLGVYAAKVDVKSPDGKLIVSVSDDGGVPGYEICYDGMAVLDKSALGLKTDIADFTSGLSIISTEKKTIDKEYEITRTKTSFVHYVANKLDVVFKKEDGKMMKVTFCVSDNDVAYRYTVLPLEGSDCRCTVIYKEASSFNFPRRTTTFLCPQTGPMAGWKRTKPSYEEDYTADAPMNAKSAFGHGYTFPCLFRIGNDGWALVSETGVDSGYCGSHLSDYVDGKGYTIAFPDKGENNGFGSEFAAIPIPGSTPWRTITFGKTLKPIVETTVQFDFVEPKYDASTDYKPGRYTWSWLLWQDNSINYDDQVAFINLAAEMGYEYTLVDAGWDVNIGRNRMAELSRYAQSKGVNLLLWYNSNGFANDAPPTPHHCMNTAIAREKEMKWLKSIGVKGIKVDFFGGDKQETMRLYEDILSDANRYGLQVIFHGCTIPRGWERMYPNYVGSEAVLASENLYFEQKHCDLEGFELTMHPFSRNTIGSMDWGGVVMKHRMGRGTDNGNFRRTTDVFEMATAITNQASMQCIAVQPDNIDGLPQFEKDFLKAVPTTWDETRFIDGYPTKYVVIARRHGNDWYVGGLNGTDKSMTLTICLPMFTGQKVKIYADNEKKTGEANATSTLKSVKVGSKGMLKVTIQPLGGIIITK